MIAFYDGVSAAANVLEEVSVMPVNLCPQWILNHTMINGMLNF